MDHKKKDSFDGPECANCAATKSNAGQPLSQKCSRCKLLAYCSRECQVQHWKSGDHKKWCLTPKERSVRTTAALAKKEEHEETSCPVCLESIVPAKKDLNVTLPCLHVFHISCVEDLRSHALHQACPLCRAELPSRSDTSAKKNCANCGKDKCSNGAPLVSCANCKLVLYCGRDCQRAHWKHGHKAICAQAQTQQIMAELNKPLGFLGTTQLLEAVSKKQIAKVRKLLVQGAAVNQGSTHDGFAPLHIAAEKGYAEMASLLIGGGAAVQATSDNGTTPLYAAAQQGQTKMARLLIGSGAAVNQARTDNGTTPLHIAAENGHIKLVILLIDRGAAVNQASTDDGTTPLICAADHGHAKEVVRLLIGAGANVNQARTDDGATSLFVAAGHGYSSMVAHLIELGADTNYCTLLVGWSPLFVAASSGHAEVVRILLAAGADKTVATTAECCGIEAGCTPLAIAIRLEHSEVSRLLLS